MSTEKVDLMSDQDTTAMQPHANLPAYSPNPTVLVKGGTQQHPVDPDMNTIYLSIFTMLFCCWPCGLVGLISGIQGMQQHYRGQYASAERTTKSAKKWTICGIVSGVIYIVAIIFIVILGSAIRFALTYKYSDE